PALCHTQPDRKKPAEGPFKEPHHQNTGSGIIRLPNQRATKRTYVRGTLHSVTGKSAPNFPHNLQISGSFAKISL
ncbi:MAG TPA: hypothetical protein PK379_13775, partial [Candidatus Hydrogenedentes bacterium]|nr:hypothetical protein [Candidatus Hydrogenedentota bacterium]